MPEQPEISIIIPVYNAATTLKRCLQSVVSSHLTGLEIICINDGSTDNSGRLLADWAQQDSRIKVLAQDNAGVSTARNLGLRQASGQYIVFVDADDMLESQTLSECYGQILAHAPDIVVYGIRLYNSEANLFPIRVRDGVYSLSDPSNGIIENILMSPMGSFVFPKSLSGKAFLREKLVPYQQSVPKDVRIGEDGACFVGVCLHSETVAVISHVRYLCTVNANSVSHSSDPYALRRCLSLFAYYNAVIAEKGELLQEQFRRYVVDHLFSSLQFVAASKVGGSFLRKEFRAVMQNDIVKDAVTHATFDKKAKKMMMKQKIIQHGMLFAVRLLVRTKSTIS